MEVEGFEEILEYIESENKYRQLGQTSSISTTSTEEEVSDGTDQLSSGDVELLEKDLSQARVIEYIINYKYKRITNRKQDIKVLEIMPDENCSQIDDKTVVNWLSDKEATKNENNMQKMSQQMLIAGMEKIIQIYGIQTRLIRQ